MLTSAFVVGAVGVESAVTASEGSNALLGAVHVMEGAVNSAKVAAGDASTVLELVHNVVFPERDMPRGLGPLASAFDKQGDFLESFARANVVSSFETVFMVLMGHGLSADYETVVSSVPECTEEQSLRASELACHLQKVVAEYARTQEDVE